MKNQSKLQIRNCIKEIKKSMTEVEISEKSSKIQNLLMETEEFKAAMNIYIYINYNQEVVTTDIIEKSLELGKKVYVPKVCGDVIRFYRITSVTDDLAPGAFGILEPTGECTDESCEGLLIMPGLAFDKEFHRIGYGGGYYDKYLSHQTAHIKIALAYEFQILESIPEDEFDVKVDIIITENKVTRR